MQPNQGPQSLPPPMWCPDPAGTNRLRWWGGSKWTDQYAQIPAPEPAVSAMPAVVTTHNSSLFTDYTLQPTGKQAMPSSKGERSKLISTCRCRCCSDA